MLLIKPLFTFFRFSALKIDGKRLYDYAREGIPLPKGRTIESRSIIIHELELIDFWENPDQVIPLSSVITTTMSPPLPDPRFRDRKSSTDTNTNNNNNDISSLQTQSNTDPSSDAQKNLTLSTGPIARIRAVVSSGTYIRSLIYDLGNALGTKAYMSALHRTRQAGCSIDQSIDINKATTLEGIAQGLDSLSLSSEDPFKPSETIENNKNLKQDIKRKHSHGDKEVNDAEKRQCLIK